MSTQVERPKASRSLMAVLTTAFLALSVAGLSIVGISEMYLDFRTQQEAVASRQQFIAQGAADTVASFVQEKYRVLETAAQLLDPTSASQTEQENVLAGLLGLEPAFRQLVLLDAQSQELSRTSRLSQEMSGSLIDRVGPDWLAQLKQGYRFIGAVYVDEATSEPLIVIAVPATDVFGDYQGALAAEVNLKFMWDLVDRLAVGETGVAYVVDRQGSLIAFGDVGRVLRGENVGQLREVGEFVGSLAPVDETGASISPGINGTTVVGTYVPLGTPDWAVVTELPVTEAYREVIRSMVISAGVILAMAVLAGLIGVYLARRLARPLLTLTDTAARIAGGETGLQAAMAGPQEVVHLAEAFNSMTAQLQELIGGLEQRVADRTRGLQATAEVARVVVSQLDPNALLSQVVELVRERFELYYVGLFLLDEKGQWAVLRAGTGAFGQAMLAQEHRLEVGGKSMIGRCVARNQVDLAQDVGDAAVRFDNPLLPDTRSELALPMRSRGRVIGAMSVQSAEEAAFSESYVDTLQAMADQVAVAIDNARLFADAQAALAELEALQQRYLGEAWTEYVQGRKVRGYARTQSGEMALDAQVLPEVRQAIAARRPIIGRGRSAQGSGTRAGSTSSSSALVAPILYRGQAIGGLGVRDVEGSRQWREADIRLAQAISEQFAQAAENLRLLEQTQRGAARERTVAEAAAQMREPLELEDVLRIAASEMRQALDLDTLAVHLTVPEADEGST
jgi:GAF domain-containing protein/HAMP domain-containing protein